MIDNTAIKVSNVSKTFILPHEKNTSIKSAFINFYKRKKAYEKQEALTDISFEVKKGEFFGIVGRNGSGKSTLLKLLAGIYTPDSGDIQINGKLTPFIELGVGFNPELSGRDNVFLNGALLGFSRTEMESMYDEIIAFAELERFMDQKLKNYSSGMQVRLAFSIAIRANTDILVLDEVLAVGDEAFQRKCYEYFVSLKRNKKTVILVTHDMGAVERFCTKAMLVSEGKIQKIDEPGGVAKEYIKLNEAPVNIVQTKKKETSIFQDAHIVTKVCNADGRQVDAFNPEDKIRIELNVKVLHDITDAVVGVTIEKPNQETIYAITTEDPQEELPKLIKAGTQIKLTYVIDNIFGENTYIIDSAIVTKDRALTYFREDEAAEFKIQNRGKKGWLLHPETKLDVELGKVR